MFLVLTWCTTAYGPARGHISVLPGLWHIMRITYELRDNYVDDPDTQRMAPSLDAIVSSELLPKNAGISCAARDTVPCCYGQC